MRAATERASGVERPRSHDRTERLQPPRRLQRAALRRERRRRRLARAGVIAVALVALLLPDLRPPATQVSLLDRFLAGQVPFSSARVEDDPIGVHAAALEAVEVPEDTVVPLGRLVIPKIGLDTAYHSGVHETVLERGPGHWPGTPLPGQPGNAVLSGHRTTFTAPFNGLDLLVPGDEVRVESGGRATVYRVTGTTIEPEATYPDAVLPQPADPAERTITMFACHPKGSAQQRIVVKATAYDDPQLASSAAGGE